MYHLSMWSLASFAVLLSAASSLAQDKAFVTPLPTDAELRWETVS